MRTKTVPASPSKALLVPVAVTELVRVASLCGEIGDLTSSLRLEAEGFPCRSPQGFLVHQRMPSLIPSRFG